MNIFANHVKLYTTALGLFVVLSLVVAIGPAVRNQRMAAPLPGAEPLSEEARKGKLSYIAQGCVACHSQQVRNVAMDRTWGARPGVAADYADNHRMSWWMNTATLMGTGRIGPDLTDIGNRLPAEDWHLLHLFNPRAVVAESIMPAHPWLFEIKEQAGEQDRVVPVPQELLNTKGVVVAKAEALYLVAYLQSLKQVPLPDGSMAPDFLYTKEPQSRTLANGSSLPAGEVLVKPDGALLYAANCQACHQITGEGLRGAFPPLKESAIVLADKPDVMVAIILQGYDAREEYGAMPAIGTINRLTPAEITAIVNHERTSWGNNRRTVTQEEVETIITSLKKEEPIP